MRKLFWFLIDITLAVLGGYTTQSKRRSSIGVANVFNPATGEWEAHGIMGRID